MNYKRQSAPNENVPFIHLTTLTCTSITLYNCAYFPLHIAP